MEYAFEVLLAGLATYAAISIVWYIILAVANWKIFTKAGEAGWKSIIPFVNTYVLFKISWNKMMFWLTLILLVLGGVFSGLAGDEGGFLTIIALICYLVAAVIEIIQVHKLSKSFGHGIGFTLGLLFLSPIFTLILGFGSSQYIGPNGVNANTASSDI